MTLVKTSILSFIATAIKLLSALVINKAVAVYIGPTGIALIGQFQNFMQLTMTAAQGGINNGVTKYTAEYGKENEQLAPLLSTALRISFICSALLGLLLIVLSKQVSNYFLNSYEFSYIFVIFGVSISLFVINQLLLSVINGFKEIKLFISINITQSLYSLIITTMLVVMFGLDGALIALVTNQSVVLVVILWRIRNHAIIKLSLFKDKFDWKQFRKLLSYSAMAITTAATIPVSHLIVRDYIGANLGWEEAGYWQAVWYISTMYLTVVTTALGIYYVPRLSEISDNLEIRKELLNGYKVIIPIVILMALVVYFLKDLIIFLLFTKDFKPMRELFLWQLIGDVMKISSFLLASLMLAKAMTRIFIVTQIIFSTLFVVLSIFFINELGLVGVTYAYFTNYSLYLITMIFIMRKFIFKV
jgi:O-antigen/teichoic acid export membrane protein